MYWLIKKCLVWKYGSILLLFHSCKCLSMNTHALNWNYYKTGVTVVKSTFAVPLKGNVVLCFDTSVLMPAIFIHILTVFIFIYIYNYNLKPFCTPQFYPCFINLFHYIYGVDCKSVRSQSYVLG